MSSPPAISIESSASNGFSKSIANGSYRKLEWEGGVKGRVAISMSLPWHFFDQARKTL